MAGLRLEGFPALMDRLARAVREAEGELTRLDAAAGDGDLGVNMTLGFESMAAAAAAPCETYSQVFLHCAAALNQAAPSTLGTVLSAALTGFAARAGDAAELDLPLFAQMLEEGRRQMMDLGGAVPGDKTILDAWGPYAEVLSQCASSDARTALQKAAQAAARAAEDTAELSPKIGRARMYGEKAAGIPDGGAVLFALLARELARD